MHAVPLVVEAQVKPSPQPTINPEAARIAQAVADLDAWLETMRVTGGSGLSGYGGPVVHWWQNCLGYTGPGLDWRYEGIITGYLTLWQRTGERRWPAKACRAGDDLVAGQQLAGNREPGTGNYPNSSFEMNPYGGGTPHEAAASLGLLKLAQALRAQGDDRWRTYAATAERNLRGYAIGRLWDEAARSFRDDPDVPSLVPNKACTLAEALFALAEITGADELIERYALPTLEAVLSLQVAGPTRLAGAIPQAVLRGQVVGKYFPYYNARCVPALVLAYDHTGEQRYLDGAVAVFDFVARHVDGDGLLPQVLYPRGVNRYPQWIAPLGDLLRVADLLRRYGFDADLTALRTRLLDGQLPTGGIVTGRGFGAQVRRAYAARRPPDVRDLVPVAGWVDKAFRYLAGHVPVGMPLPPAAVAECETACEIRGRCGTWTETEVEMTLVAGGATLYRWRKGAPWASVVRPEVMWK